MSSLPLRCETSVLVSPTETRSGYTHLRGREAKGGERRKRTTRDWVDEYEGDSANSDIGESRPTTSTPASADAGGDGPRTDRGPEPCARLRPADFGL